MMYFDMRASALVSPFLASGRFWRGHLIIMETQVKTSIKRVSVGQKLPNHGTRVEWEYKSSISWTYLCSGVFKKQVFSPFWCVISHLLSTIYSFGKHDSAARDVIWIARGNSIIIGGNATARATAKPSTVHLVSSSAASVLFNSEGNGKFGPLKYIFSMFWW